MIRDLFHVGFWLTAAGCCLYGGVHVQDRPLSVTLSFAAALLCCIALVAASAADARAARG